MTNEPSTSDGATRRLLLYVAGLLAVLGGLELLLRAERPLFLAASHRATFKAASYVARGGADIVFLGSSRTADGVLPAVVGGDTFNLAISGTSIEVLEWIADNVPPPRRLALIEVSVPQSLSRRPTWLPPDEGDDIEAELQRTLAAHLELIALRRAFRLDSLARLGATLFAARLDGAEITAADYARAIVGQRATPGTSGTSAFRRTLVAPQAPNDGSDEALAARYAAVAGKLGKVVFFTAPLRFDEPQEQLLGALARNAPVWEISAEAVPESWFRNRGHLTRQGAVELSAALGEWLATDGHAVQ